MRILSAFQEKYNRRIQTAAQVGADYIKRNAHLTYQFNVSVSGHVSGIQNDPNAAAVFEAMNANGFLRAGIEATGSSSLDMVFKQMRNIVERSGAQLEEGEGVLIVRPVSSLALAR